METLFYGILKLLFVWACLKLYIIFLSSKSNRDNLVVQKKINKWRLFTNYYTFWSCLLVICEVIYLLFYAG